MMLNINLYHHFINESEITAIKQSLDTLIKQGEVIMSTLKDLQDKLVELGSAIVAEKVEVQGLLTALKAQIGVLQGQVTAGSPVSQADLDNLVLAVNDIITGVKEISEPVVTPVVTPVVPPVA